MRNEYKFRLSRMRRKNIPLKYAVKFKTPQHFSLFNDAIRIIENRIRKKYSARAYVELINKFSEDYSFNRTCDIYLNDSENVTKPSFTKINKEQKYTVNNLRMNKLQKSNIFKSEKTLRSEMNSINTRMKKSVGLDFLLKFDNPDKIRFLLMQLNIDAFNRKYEYTVEYLKEYFVKFYDDKRFNRLYVLYKKTGNRFIKPSLDHKIPVSKGGTNDLENLHFISFLENNCKNDMTWNDWLKIKKNLDKFLL